MSLYEPVNVYQIQDRERGRGGDSVYRIVQVFLADMKRRRRSASANPAACPNFMARRKRIKLCNGEPGGAKKNQGVEEADVRVTLVGCNVTGRVLFLEAGESFVELLLSFLVLPIGTVVKLCPKVSLMISERIG